MATNPITIDQELDIAPQGVEVKLEIPAGEEVESLYFNIEALPGEENISTTLTDDKDDKDLVGWVTADWGTRLPISVIQVVLPENTTVSKKGRLKIFDGGAWFPASPLDIIELGSECRLPVIPASKVMVEIVTMNAQGWFESARTKVTGVSVKAAKQPYDLSISLSDNPPFFQKSGLMSPGETIPVEIPNEPINQMLSEKNEAILNNNEFVNIPLILHSLVPGKVKVSAEITTVTVKKTLDGERRASSQLPLPWDGEAIGQVTIGAGSIIKKIGFKISADLTAERAYISPKTFTTHAQLCDPTHTAAQGFSPLPEDKSLVGLDLYLRPLNQTVKGSIAIYPDLMGRPADTPFGGAVFDIELKAENAAQMEPQWLSHQLPRQLRLSDKSWWVVFTVTEGEAHWYLSCDLPDRALGTMYRLDSGAWFPRKLLAKDEDKEPQIPWALTRIRVAAKEPPEPKVILRRGKTSIKVPLKPDGRVILQKPKNLEKLNQGAAFRRKMLEIAVSSQSSGIVTISDTEVRFKKT